MTIVKPHPKVHTGSIEPAPVRTKLPNARSRFRPCVQPSCAANKRLRSSRSQISPARPRSWLRLALLP